MVHLMRQHAQTPESPTSLRRPHLWTRMRAVAAGVLYISGGDGEEEGGADGGSA